MSRARRNFLLYMGGGVLVGSRDRCDFRRYCAEYVLSAKEEVDLRNKIAVFEAETGEKTAFRDTVKKLPSAVQKNRLP